MIKLDIINLKALRKVNATTFVDKVGTILLLKQDYALPNRPILFRVMDTKGKELFTRSEAAAAAELKL